MSTLARDLVETRAEFPHAPILRELAARLIAPGLRDQCGGL